MFFFATILRLGKFKRPQSELPPWVTKSPQEEYVFTESTGYPESVRKQFEQLNSQLAGKPLGRSNHLDIQSQRGDPSHGINLQEVPNINSAYPRPEHGFRVTKLHHNGKNVTQLSMRGPFNDAQDVTIPVDVKNPNAPHAITMFRNDREDNHQRTLDLRRVHLPHEFVPGKAPKRRLSTDVEATQPGYRPIRHHETGLIQNMLSQHGVPMPPSGNPGG